MNIGFTKTSELYVQGVQMNTNYFPFIDVQATGKNIKRLRQERGLSVKDLQNYFGFEEPQAIYKWQWGQCLPSVDNLFALCYLLDVRFEDILVAKNPEPQPCDCLAA